MSESEKKLNFNHLIFVNNKLAAECTTDSVERLTEAYSRLFPKAEIKVLTKAAEARQRKKAAEGLEVIIDDGKEE